MKLIKIVIILLLITAPIFTFAFSINEIRGRILLQVEKKGEAWYVEPVTSQRIYLGRPRDAFLIMKKFSTGISRENLNKISVCKQNSGGDIDFTKKYLGKIFLDVENNGEAWYIEPVSECRIYLGRPDDAFNIMKKTGLGVTDETLGKIEIFNERNYYLLISNDLIIYHNVPFTSQASLAEWNDERQQDGCEEASVLMAIKWARGEELNSKEARDVIIEISNYEEKEFGSYVDTSAADTRIRLISGYFQYINSEVVRIETKYDIIKYLSEEKIILAPTKGVELGNPNFTYPGPETHFLVIKGYNKQNHKFITNDPGTRNGLDYLYNEDVLFNAINDYPTGDHELNNVNKKNVILVWK